LRILWQRFYDKEQKLLAQHVEVEMRLFKFKYEDLKDQRGYQRVVRNGYMPAGKYKPVLDLYRWKPPGSEIGRRILISKGYPSVQHIAPYLRKTKSMEQLIPGCIWKDFTGILSDALVCIGWQRCYGLSAPTITAQSGFGSRNFSNGKSVVFQRNVTSISGRWDYCNVRMDDKQCLLSLWAPLLMCKGTGGDRGWFPWKWAVLETLLLDLKSRGLTTLHNWRLVTAPWFLESVEQSLRPHPLANELVHKTANILNSFAQELQSKAKSKLHQIWQAVTEWSPAPFQRFVKTYEAKYPTAASVWKRIVTLC